MKDQNCGLAGAQQTRRQTNAHHRAFTLIELLIVVAILALLVSILMPSLAAARRSSKRTACGANLSGIGKAVQAYLYSNHDYYPCVATWPPDEEDNADAEGRDPYPPMYDAFREELMANTDDDMKGHLLFKCPADHPMPDDPSTGGRTYFEYAGTSYEWNPLFNPNAAQGEQRVRIGKDSLRKLGVKLEARQPLIYDCRPFHHKDPQRMGSVMYLFADLHVAADRVDASSRYEDPAATP